MAKCSLCGKQLETGVEKCGYCGHPTPTIVTSPTGDSTSIWNEMNSLTHWVIIILIPLVIIGNPIAGIIGALVGYFWFAPWTATFAKEHNRNKNWGYFFGFLGLIPLAIYWVYVKLTQDPRRG
jgi:hypothetical protein